MSVWQHAPRLVIQAINMSKLKIIVPAFALLLAAVYGGFKGYIYYQVSSQLDELIEMAAPFAHISYGGISSTLDGRLTVENIQVIPQGVPDEASIDAIGVRGDGPVFLLRLLSGLKEGDPPKKLDFFVRGFKVALNGEFAAHYTGLLQGFRQETDGQTLDSCDFGGWVSPDAFRALGMDAFMVDMNMGYRFVQGGDELQAHLEFGVQGVETTNMDVTLTGVPQPGMVMMGAMPKLEDFAIGYQLDPEFSAAALGRCAQARGQTVEAYLDALFESEEQFAQTLGFVPGPGISQALKAFLLQPGEVRINTQLPVDFDPTTLGLYAPKDWVEILGLELDVNGVQITDLSFTLPTVSAGMAGSSWISRLTGTDQLPAASTTGMGTDGAGKEEQARRLRREFVATPVAELRGYVGKDVRLYTVNAEAPRIGELLSINNVEATVVQHVHGGKMAAHVPLSEITKAEVLMVLEVE